MKCINILLLVLYLSALSSPLQSLTPSESAMIESIVKDITAAQEIINEQRIQLTIAGKLLQNSPQSYRQVLNILENLKAELHNEKQQYANLNQRYQDIIKTSQRSERLLAAASEDLARLGNDLTALSRTVSDLEKRVKRTKVIYFGLGLFVGIGATYAYTEIF